MQLNARPAVKSSYKQYLLTVLLVILALNFTDRFALGVVLQDIKVELQLTDTQLGFLTGIAFALFYSTMGIPIARWADRGNRVTIITLTTALWSAAVALCGFAGNFLQLLLIRVGVAVGEAGCIPPAHSLIADYFSRDQRPRAVSRYMLGVPLSFVLGYFVAGWLNELYGWRITFILLGTPGLALALLSWLTLKEPRVIQPSRLGSSSSSRSQHEPAVSSSTEPTFKAVCTTLWRSATFRHLLLSFAVVYFFGYGILLWQPAFFIRSYGLQTGELGTWLAVIHGFGGLLGTYFGGEFATRYAAHNERLQLKAAAVVFCIFGASSVCAYLSPTPYLAFGFLMVAAIGLNSTSGPLFATIQTLVPERMRAMSIAVLYLFANLVGMGLGPIAAGALSDALLPRFGAESLRYSLVILCPGYLWGAWHLWRASKTVAHDIGLAEVAMEEAELYSFRGATSAEPARD